MNKPRVVVCAAVRARITKVIICSPRHFDRESCLRMIEDSNQWFDAEQGFVDQYGEFMTREEAYLVAKTAQQIKYRCGGDEGKLFSENLY